MPHPDNAGVANRLDEVATILEQRGANPYRVAAYRRAAQTLRTAAESVDEIFRTQGLDGLERLPGVGRSLARSIRQLVTTGRLPMLERLRTESPAEALLMTVPGIGRRLAGRLHEELGIDSLAQLEAAAHDGRLHDIAGIGEKRLEGIRDVLAGRLGRVRQPLSSPPDEEPPVSEVLDVDREYRAKAQAGELRMIAPRRFNPTGEAWLPVLHTRRGSREYTALFSNTARAHRMGRTRDWVVLSCGDRGGGHLYTVITAARGGLRGRRIVRGREAECEQFYPAAPAAA